MQSSPSQEISEAFLMTSQDYHLINPYIFSEAIDTTGAGDLYASGFLHCYINGKDLRICGQLGSICAGQIVTQLGSRSRVPLKKILRENLL